MSDLDKNPGVDILMVGSLIVIVVLAALGVAHCAGVAG